eukprot:TRINITY_DN2472_c0_g2_i1.p1 TRINITY_DN2472_c0_g2~~TRINITY_DN2472_c0_g2_i1.p1  ORF type:complete len:322 (-),score=51.80 TRINITY_DN2472_c0_g2_i1:232-1197(-)
MRVLIAGATGLVGKELVKALLSRGDTVITLGRSKTTSEKVFGNSVTAESYDSISAELFQSLDAVVNLAGENIGGAGRWSDEVKGRILQSRLDVTERLSSLMSLANCKARLLNASATGIYGHQDNDSEVKDEESEIPTSNPDFFLAEVCIQWERMATEKLPADRVVLLRTGIVLAKAAGALGQMEMPFRLGLGGRLGSGTQVMSWITLQDEVRAIVFCLDHPEISGPINLVAGAVPQMTFAESLAAALHRPCILPAPGFAVKLLLGTEMAEGIVLSSHNVNAKKLRNAGFRFEDEHLDETLARIYSSQSCSESCFGGGGKRQ